MIERNQNLHRVLFFLILIAAFVLRIINLEKGYNSDETLLLSFVNADLAQLIPLLKDQSVYPPLTSFLLHFWVKLGNLEIWVRGYFVLFGLLTCVMVYAIGREFRSKGFGLIVFFIAAISPLLIWASQFVRSYIDSAFWALFSTYFLMKLLKDDWRLKIRFGYIITSVLGVYTFYFNIFFIASQNIYFLIMRKKEFKKIKNWFLLQMLIGISFVPGAFLAMEQTKSATGINPVLVERGFKLFGLHVGYYARSLAALIGMDPAFLFTQPLTKMYSKGILIALAFLAFVLACIVLFYAIRSLERIEKKKELAFIYPLIPLFYAIVFLLLVEFLNFPINAKYFVSSHALFIGAIGAVIYSFNYQKVIAICIFALLLLTYGARWKYSVLPEFDTKKADFYLEKNMEENECLIMARNTNYYFNTGNYKSYIFRQLMVKDRESGNYISFSEKGEESLVDMKNNCKTLWFYKSYGNDELLKRNSLLSNWLEINYKKERVEKLRRIELIHYKRGLNE